MAGGKNRETVTASLCLVFKGRGRNLVPPLIKSINNLFPGEKACQISWHCSRNRLMRDEKSLVTAKKRQSPQVQMRAVFVA